MLDLLIVVAFVIYGLGVGLRARSKASESLQEYFLAGKTIKDGAPVSRWRRPSSPPTRRCW